MKKLRKLQLGDVIEYDARRKGYKNPKLKRFLINNSMLRQYTHIGQENFQKKYTDAKYIGNVYDSLLEIRLIFENSFNDENHNVYGVFIEDIDDSQMFQGNLQECWDYVLFHFQEVMRKDLF